MIVNKYINGGGGGATGPQGPQGPQGVEGAQGIAGVDGQNGAEGAQGPQGVEGADGAQGPQGVEGAMGARGSMGPQGADGQDGAQGPQGPAGDGSSASAYKIELSTNIPDDFTETDIANLNAFYTAYEADPSIAEGAYVDVSGDIYRCTYDNGEGEFIFVFNSASFAYEVDIIFFNGEYGEGNYYEWNSETLIPYTEFPADPIEGQITNYNDGNGNIELYRYDGSDWVPFTTGGDNTILKSVSGTPEGAASGDVYAVFVEAQDAVIGDTWTDTGIWDLYWDRDGNGNPQAVRIQAGSGIFSFRYACTDWDTAVGVQIGNDAITLNDMTGWEQKSDGSFEFVDSDWMEKTGGETVRIFYQDGYVYAYSTDVSVIWPYGITDNYTAQNPFTGEITPATDNSFSVYQATDGEPIELAKVSDLPASINLVPDGEPNYGLILRYDEAPNWVHPSDITATQFINIETEGAEEVYPAYLKRVAYEGFVWSQLDFNELQPVSAAPVTSKDGSVYALSSSGYGIVQAQSSRTETTWFNFEGETFPQGVVTKVRVPYNDTAESNIVHFKTDPNGEGEWNLYWHPEDTNNRHWDGVPDGYSQNDGEFSAVDTWGNTMVAAKVGDYIEVTFGAPLYDGDEQISTQRNTEAYTEGSVANYSNVVLSDMVSKIWKGTQEQYDAMSGHDATTIYMITE